MNWKTTFTQIHNQISNPKGHYISQIGKLDSSKRRVNSHIKISFPEFKYISPIYDDQYIREIEIENINFPTSKNIISFNQYTFENTNPYWQAKLSQELDLYIHSFKIEKVNGYTFDSVLEYSIINSDSYGEFEGAFDDHLKLKFVLNFKLEIDELIICAKDTDELQRIIDKLNPQLYNNESSKCFKTNYSIPDFDFYKLRYADTGQSEIFKQKKWFIF